jgi:hypothetical protein
MLVISIILKAQSKYILVSPERQYRKEKHQADNIHWHCAPETVSLCTMNELLAHEQQNT